ncbi:ABC transporter permease [Paenibacillus albicereus]|uniref:ABC transporter permease n=1 Tax=Paenibacillus albicereus TaxID=2726185 RepID=A0A6H2H321_9BACL|nr:ABC transporter permease [Paenibacillus albicereus]QJC54057.1 ABC transporter permease [Paenibacillus albicereus]
MLNLLRSESYKLFRNRSLWLLAAVLAASAIAYVLMAYFDDPGDGGTLSATSGLDLLAIAMSGNTYIIKIGLCVLAGFFISSEYSAGTIKRGAASGYGRSRFIAAKLLVFIGGSVLVALIFPAVIFALGSALMGVGEMPGGASAADYVWRSLLVTITLSAAFAAVTGAVATVLTDSGKTIGVLFVFYFFADGLYVFIGKFIPFVETMYRHSIFSLISRYADPAMSSAQLAQSIYIPLLVAAAFIGIGIAVFERKEIR